MGAIENVINWARKERQRGPREEAEGAAAEYAALVERNGVLVEALEKIAHTTSADSAHMGDFLADIKWRRNVAREALAATLHTTDGAEGGK